MTNAFFDPGQQRAAKVNDLFTQIAPRYDLINDLQSFGLHRYWKRRVVTFSGASPTSRALDICCGTGDLTFSMAARGARVVGLDFNSGMLAMAAKRSNSHPALFVRGDAQRLPFPDCHFDVVTVGYGLRNLASWETGLAELWRVSKPRGRIVILDFGKPDNALWRALYFTYLRLFVPCLGLIFCGNAAAYAYILESLKHYPAQNGVAARMREMKFTNVRIINILGGVMSINYAEKPV